MVTHYGTDPDSGLRALFRFYGEHEISFDEPDLFAFGETLALQSQFAAGEATDWGTGYDWSRIRPLLQHLVDVEILRVLADDATSDRDRGASVDGGARLSPLPPAPCAQPRFWSEGPALMAELTGRGLDTGHLEMVMPVFRVAHVALDAEGRQVGESNVFPKALRVEVPTRWRTCIYPGTRHQSDRPMNVSALKSMRGHWPQMMAALARIRCAYLERFPQARGAWTVGHVEQLATMVLAVPTYALLHPKRPVANGGLHPVLSSLFRVSDGLRMAMHQMLFVPIGEPARPADAATDVQDVLAYAERNYSFHSEHGVCAGPRVMIEEFLTVLLDGGAVDEPAGGFEPAVRQALDDLDAAIDYGLRGLRVYAAMFSLWPAMARAIEALAGAAAQWTGEPGERAATLREQLDAALSALRDSSYLGTEARRSAREAVYRRMYAQCGEGLGLAPEQNNLAEALSRAERGEQLEVVARAAAVVLSDTLATHPDAPAVRRFADGTARFALRLRAVMAVALQDQRQINRMLGRVEPARAFEAADADLHNLLQGTASRRVPYLPDLLRAFAGLHLAVDEQDVVVTEERAQARPVAGDTKDSVDMVSVDVACDSHASSWRAA